MESDSIDVEEFKAVSVPGSRIGYSDEKITTFSGKSLDSEILNEHLALPRVWGGPTPRDGV